MLITPGPKRIILIRAGRFDYAEVVLGSSTHLVGPNNVGKTSLIACLQFLYIAAFSEMKFSRPWDESQRYYFQDDASTILFETATADGRFVTLGLRGRGQMGGYHVDRFAFEGPYRRDDFLSDDSRVREFTEVKARLAGERYFKLLDPADIRAAVVGDYTAVPALNMGIVPLKNPARYSDFVYLLKNLLRLNSLSQKDIKDTLLTVYRHDIQTVEIDLYGTYADLHAKLTAERAKLDNLRKVKVLAASLKGNRAKRELARRDLPAMYVTVLGSKARAMTALQKSVNDADRSNVELDQADQTASIRHHELEEQNKAIIQDLTRATDWISAVDDEGVVLRDYLPDIAQQERQNLSDRIDGLTAKIVNPGDPAALERALTELKATLQQTIEQRDKHANLLGTRLQTRLGAGAIADLGRIFHPAILRLPVEPGAIEISDEELLVAALKKLHGQVENGRFRAAGVEVALDRIAGSDTVAVKDIATLNAEIASLDLRVKQAEEALNTARNMAALKIEHDNLKRLLRTAETTALRYEQWQKNVKLVPAKRRECQQLKIAQTANLTSRTTLGDEAKKRVELRAAIKTSLADLTVRQRELNAIRPVPVDAGWLLGAEDPEWLSMDAREINSLYGQTHDLYLEADAEVARVLDEAEVVCQDGFPGANQDERIDALIEAVDSFGEHERSFRDQLGFVINGMRASFNNMFKAYKDLVDCVTDFNRSIGKVSISNLSQMALELYENTEVTKHYRSVSTSDLLEEPGKTEEAIKFIADTIDNTRVLRLSDWFGVRFVITTANGEAKRYDDLTVMESNGTTMAIKILVNIVLIRAMMRKNKPFMVPFYIDEATQIDEANLKEIVALANDKGFCPVLASTVPASVAEHIDFVRRVGNNRAVIDPKWRITRQAKRAEADANAA
ncbi:MAG: hypothetical protein M0P95_18005 [Sulfuritalea sp.]|jgi:hypothetical protein|nr:hypothetical protein [Sulfuritalea sp.]